VHLVGFITKKIDNSVCSLKIFYTATQKLRGCAKDLSVTTTCFAKQHA